MKSRQIIKGMIGAVYIGILFSLIGFRAYAAENPIEVIIPVSQDFSIQTDSTAAPAQAGKYELYAETTDSPMPEGSKNSRFEFSIDGSNTSTEIKFWGNRPGIYHYTLRQISEEADNCTYDRTVYAITVYIENTPDEMLSSQIVVQNGENGKCAEIRFQNHFIYHSSSAQTPETGDQGSILVWKLICLTSLIGVVVFTIVIKKLPENA